MSNLPDEPIETCLKCGGHNIQYDTPNYGLKTMWLEIWCEDCDFIYFEEYIFSRYTNDENDTLDKNGNPCYN